MRTFNDEIKQIGLLYFGHYNKSILKVIGSSWGIEISKDRIRDFTKIFPDVNWEDGEYLECLKGRYIRVTVDDDSYIYSLSHIIKDLTYTVNIEKE